MLASMCIDILNIQRRCLLLPVSALVPKTFTDRLFGLAKLFKIIKRPNFYLNIVNIEHQCQNVRPHCPTMVSPGGGGEPGEVPGRVQLGGGGALGGEAALPPRHAPQLQGRGRA